MQPPTPRRRRARPVPDAPLEVLAADGERLARGWLIEVIEQRPLSEVPAVAGSAWAEEAASLCAAAVRALGSEEALERIRRPTAELPGSLDALRAVLWSALRSAWPEAGPDQVWDLGERLAVVVETLREAGGSGGPGSAWPGPLEEAIARARGEGEELALLVAELLDADRMLAVESREECAAAMSRCREAIRRAAGTGRTVLDGGEARAWVIAPGLGRQRALELGSEIAAAVRDSGSWRGGPLGASVGVAALGEDGDDARALIEAAEEAMFAAAASGIEIERRPR